MTTEPPTYRPIGEVKTKTPAGVKTVARWGQCPERNCRVAVAVKRDHQRFHSLGESGGFAFSDSAIETMAGLGIRRVLIAEPESNGVYEYYFRRFLTGDPVPASMIEHESDPQTWVDRADPDYLWAGHAEVLHG